MSLTKATTDTPGAAQGAVAKRKCRRCPICKFENGCCEAVCRGCQAIFRAEFTWNYRSTCASTTAGTAAKVKATSFTITVSNKKKVEKATGSKDNAAGTSKIGTRQLDRGSVERVFPAMEFHARMTVSMTMPLLDTQYILSHIPPLCGVFGSQNASCIISGMPVWIRIASISSDILHSEVHVKPQKGNVRIFTLQSFCECLSPERKLTDDGPLEKLDEFFLIHPMQMKNDKATLPEKNLFSLLANPFQSQAVLDKGVAMTRAYVSVFELISFVHACVKMYDVEQGEFVEDGVSPIDLLKGLCNILRGTYTNAPVDPYFFQHAAAATKNPSFLLQSWSNSKGHALGSLFMVDEALQSSIMEPDLLEEVEMVASSMYCDLQVPPASPSAEQLLAKPSEPTTPQELCPARSSPSRPSTSPRKTLGALLPTNLFPEQKKRRVSNDMMTKVALVPRPAAAAAGYLKRPVTLQQHQLHASENVFGLFDSRI